MINITLSLPPHRQNCSKEILEGIPCIQKFIGVEKWHRVIGEICAMVISLPGNRGLFSHTQEALHHVDRKLVAITRGIHQALTDFQLVYDDLSRRQHSFMLL